MKCLILFLKRTSTRGFEPPTPRLGVLNAGPGNFIRFHQKSLIFGLFSGSRCSVRTAFYHCFSPLSAPNCCNFVASPKISTNGWLDHSWLIYALRLSVAAKSGSVFDVPFSSISSFFLGCPSYFYGSIIPENKPVNNGISSGSYGKGVSLSDTPPALSKQSLCSYVSPAASVFSIFAISGFWSRRSSVSISASADPSVVPVSITFASGSAAGFSSFV